MTTQASRNGQIDGSSGGEIIVGQGNLNKDSSSDSKPPPNVYGFENEELALQKLLSLRGSDDQFRAIGVVGVAGIGKTTLCQRIFHSQEVKNQLVPRIWLRTTTTTPTKQHLKAETIFEKLLDRLGFDEKTIKPLLPEGQESAFLDSVVRYQLTGKRYLIVLDEFEDVEVAVHLSKVLPRGYGGRLIVTSRNEELIETIVGEENLYRLQPISDQESCWLIYRDSVRDNDLKTPARGDLEKELDKLQDEIQSEIKRIKKEISDLDKEPEPVNKESTKKKLMVEQQKLEGELKLVEEKKSMYRDSVNFPSSEKLAEELKELEARDAKVKGDKRSLYRDEAADSPDFKRREDDIEKLQREVSKLIEEKRAKQREQRLNAEELKRKCGGIPLAAKLMGKIKAGDEREQLKKEKLLKDILNEIKEVQEANRKKLPTSDEDAENEEQDQQTDEAAANPAAQLPAASAQDA